MQSTSLLNIVQNFQPNMSCCTGNFFTTSLSTDVKKVMHPGVRRFVLFSLSIQVASTKEMLALCLSKCHCWLLYFLFEALHLSGVVCHWRNLCFDGQKFWSMMLQWRFDQFVLVCEHYCSFFYSVFQQTQFTWFF